MTYLVHLKTMFVEALKETFDAGYPNPDWRKMHVSIEYPIEKAHYPGIWVDYDDVDALQIAGVDHAEYVETDNGLIQITRWKFSGFASLTVTALTSLERDRLYDELVSVIAFGRDPDSRRGRFKRYVESNDFIATNMQSDQIQPRGNVAAPGTPWGTDEIIYERTINVEVIGEFVPSIDEEEPGLIPLSRIIVRADIALDPESIPEQQDYPDADGPTAWH